jgi:hypothetical protein
MQRGIYAHLDYSAWAIDTKRVSNGCRNTELFGSRQETYIVNIFANLCSRSELIFQPLKLDTPFLPFMHIMYITPCHLEIVAELPLTNSISPFSWNDEGPMSINQSSKPSFQRGFRRFTVSESLGLHRTTTHTMDSNSLCQFFVPRHQWRRVEWHCQPAQNRQSSQWIQLAAIWVILFPHGS